jgi:type I restriction enzyme S subunit
MAEQVDSLKTGIKYKSTPIGKIPVDWELVRLEDICNIVGGSTPSTSKREFWGGDIPFATPTDITNLRGREISETDQKITSEGLSSCGTHLLPVGSILLTSRATIGACAVNTKPMATNQGFANLVCNEKAYNWFIFYKMTSLQNELERLGSGSTFKEVSKSNIRSLLIPLPVLREQKRIAEILSTLDEAIEKTDQIIEKTKEAKKGLMQKLLTRGIGHKKFKKSEIGEIPEEWKVGKLSEIAYVIMGQSPPGNSYNTEGTGCPILNGPTEFTDWSPIPVQFTTQSTKVCKEHDILFCVRGSSAGRMNIADQEYCIGRGLAAIREKSISDTKYIYYILLRLTSTIFAEASGAGSTFPNISREALGDIKIAVPPLHEQKNIADILSSADDEIEKETRHKEQLESLKKGLMQVLLTGRIRVA